MATTQHQSDRPTDDATIDSASDGASRGVSAASDEPTATSPEAAAPAIDSPAHHPADATAEPASPSTPLAMPAFDGQDIESPIESQGQAADDQRSEPAGKGSGERDTDPSGDETVRVEAPPSAGRQALQLVLIPALICLAAIGTMFLLYNMVHREDTLQTVMQRLRTTSGAGQVGMGLRDPRYQDRCRAAMSLAQMLPGIKDPAQRGEIGRDLIVILNTTVGKEEKELASYMLLAIGQLGPEGGLEAILARAESPHAMERLFAARSLASWPDPEAARAGLPQLAKLIGDQEPAVASEAARVAGVLGRSLDDEQSTADDRAVIGALRSAINGTGAGRREVVWNAAVALARLGDPQGGEVVAGVLLNREALAELPAGETQQLQQVTMPAALQDRLMVATLASAPRMTHPAVWDKIENLAANDPNLNVRKAAMAVLQQRESRNGKPNARQDAKPDAPKDDQKKTNDRPNESPREKAN